MAGGESRPISSFFSEDNNESDCRTFSQLLAGVMTSPETSIRGAIPWTPTFGEDLGGNVEALPVFPLTPGVSPGALLDTPSLLAPVPGTFGSSHGEARGKVNAEASASVMGAPSVDDWGTYKGSYFLSTQMAENPVALPGQRNQGSSLMADKTPDDLYNWKKYGQKVVKASNCTSSYFKCTESNCKVKKKVEISTEGQVTTIIYRGEHSHKKPATKVNGQSQSHADDSQAGLKSQLKNHDPLFYSGNREEGEDESDDSDHDPKRSKIRSNANESSSSRSTVTQPKIIVQTRSDVDLLDDGYRWRKYGKKTVKGNFHPRSYYRCTSEGCNVRKQVERPSNDPNAVITTYEGKHNHHVPGARNNINKRVNGSSTVMEAKLVEREMIEA